MTTRDALNTLYRAPKPRGYPRATLPEAPELRRNVAHWSYDTHASRRMKNVSRAIERAIDRVARRMVLERL